MAHWFPIFDIIGDAEHRW